MRDKTNPRLVFIQRLCKFDRVGPDPVERLLPLGVTHGHLAALRPIINLLIAYTFLGIAIDLAFLAITHLHNSGALGFLCGRLQADDPDVLLLRLLIQHILNDHVRCFVLEGTF